MAIWLRLRRCCGQLDKIKEVLSPVGQDQGGDVTCGLLVKIKEVLWPVG